MTESERLKAMKDGLFSIALGLGMAIREDLLGSELVNGYEKTITDVYNYISEQYDKAVENNK